MGDKQDIPFPPSNYRTRFSTGIRPKKRQSYGDFIEHPVVKKRISHVGINNVQKKIEDKVIDFVEPKLKKEFSALILKDCYVLVEKLQDLSSESSVQASGSFPVMAQTKIEMHKKSMVKKCSFPNCNNMTQEQFFEIPSEADLRGKWMKQLRKKFVPGMAVCIKHFDEGDVISLPNQLKPILKEGAVPRKMGSQTNVKKYDEESVADIIEELFSRKFITEEGYKLLDPFRDLTRKDIELGEKGANPDRVKSLVEAVHSCSEEAFNFFNRAIIPIDKKPVLNFGPVDYKETLLALYPNIKDVNSIKNSCDLASIFIDAKLILEGVKTLIEDSADFPLSSLDSYLNDPELKQKVNRFSKIIFLNSPQTYNKIKTPLHLPNVSSLFPSLASTEDEVHFESLTLGQLLNEASRLDAMPEESIRSLIPFGGCQLCPYSTGTVSMYKHVISSVFFNAPTFFKFLAEYLPLPSILLFAKSPLTKECDSTADQVEPQIMAPKENKKVSESPTSSSMKQNSGVMNEAFTKTPMVLSNAPVSSDRDMKDEFMRCVCPKTGRNVAKLDVDTGSFLPKDLTVKVVGHILTITGFKEENGKNIEFLRTIELPNYVDADLAGCYYFKGKMSIHAPVLDNSEFDEPLSSSATATNSECSSTFEKIGSKQASGEPQPSKDDEISMPKSSKKKVTPKSVAQFPKPSMNSNDDDIPRNLAVLMNVNGQEYVSLIAEVSKLFKPSEIIVKVKENKTISVRGETRSSDPQSKSRLYAVIEREFDLPKKIERTTLKAGCSGDGLLKIFAKVASDQNGH